MKNKNLTDFKLDEFLPVGIKTKDLEDRFVHYLQSKSTLDIMGNDRFFVISDQEFVLLVCTLVREYETFKNQIITPSDV